MGLFSFLKGSGENILNKDAEAKASAESAGALHQARVAAMLQAVEKLKLPVTNLSIELKDDVVTAYGVAETQVARELVILTLGNNKGISQVDDRISVVTPQPEADFYEVKSGDSLSKIARAYYGDARKFNIIFEANTPMLKDPNLIYPGQMLRIPRI